MEKGDHDFEQTGAVRYRRQKTSWPRENGGTLLLAAETAGVTLSYTENPESANQGTGAYMGFALQRLDSLDATRAAPPRDGASPMTSLWLRPSEARQC